MKYFSLHKKYCFLEKKNCSDISVFQYKKVFETENI